MINAALLFASIILLVVSLKLLRDARATLLNIEEIRAEAEGLRAEAKALLARSIAHQDSAANHIAAAQEFLPDAALPFNLHMPESDQGDTDNGEQRLRDG